MPSSVVVVSSRLPQQVIAQLELWNERASGRYEKKVYVLPKHLDEKVQSQPHTLVVLLSLSSCSLRGLCPDCWYHPPHGSTKPSTLGRRATLQHARPKSHPPNLPPAQVAALHLPKLGAKLTVLTDEQATYINVPTNGVNPFATKTACAALMLMQFSQSL